MELVKQLHDAGKGIEEWRVADPEDGSYCISFSWADSVNPEREAREWLEDHRKRFPNSQHAHYKVQRVMAQYQADRLMCQAADELERLRKALEEIAYSGRTKTGMKESARQALFLPQNAELCGGPSGPSERAPG